MTRPISFANVSNLVFFVVNILANVLSMTGVFGETITVISEKYQTLITPAGYAFSIWGLIFSWQAVFAIVQFLPAYRGSPLVNGLPSAYWGLACLFQVAWLVSFSNDMIVASTALLVCIWISLGAMTLFQRKLSADVSMTEFLLLSAPFYLNFGWVTVATVLGIDITLVYEEYDVSVLIGACVISLVVIGILSVLFSWNIAVSGASSWALFAVYSELANPKNVILSTYDESVIEGFQVACPGVGIILAVITVVNAVRLLFFKKDTSPVTPIYGGY